MKQIDWKRHWPIMAILAVFFTLSLVYFSPVLEGKRLVQGDKRNWQGMAQEIQEFRDAHGEEPLWTGSMFSGMPAYQISVVWSQNLLQYVDKLFHGFLPRPASFLFLYLVGMFIFLCCLKVDPWLALFGSIAFAFSSYFFVILEAGHNSKANAIGYMPAVLGGLYLLYRGRMLLGAALFALFLGLEISMNHVQVTYYLGMVMLLFVLAELVESVRMGRVMEFIKRSGLGVLAVVFALACNLGLLWSTWEYGKYTTRGASELTIQADGSSAEAIRTSGLDRDYVTDWSYGKQESFSLLVPDVKGGPTGAIGNDPDAAAKADPRFKQNIVQMNRYWGDQRFTSGPVYVGAVVVLLLLLMLVWAEVKARWYALGALGLIAVLLAIDAPMIAGVAVIAYLILGLFLWREPLSFALFGGMVLTLLLSWGKNYMPLTDFFLDIVPGYNKFRAVTIILVIVELAAPVLAVLFLDKLIKQGAWTKVMERRMLITTGSLALLLVVFAAMPGTVFDLISDAERTSFNQQADAGGANEAQIIAFVQALKEVRAGILSADAIRSLLFVLVAGGLVFLFGRRKIATTPFLLAMSALVLVDLWAVDKRYVNNDKERGRYVQWEEDVKADLPYTPSAADMAILQGEDNAAVQADLAQAIERAKADRSGAKGRASLVTDLERQVMHFGSLRRNTHYRVLTMQNPTNDSRVSYFHKSLGGYHGAKLKRYQELIEFHIVPELGALQSALQNGTNMQELNDLLARQPVLNMLNTRYLIHSNDQPPIRNLNALGPAWFVDEVRWVKNSDEEILALNTIDPARIVVVDERFKDRLGNASVDPSANVVLKEYKTNSLTYSVNSSAGGVVVLSEIHYAPDQQAYLDGVPVDHVRANYVLRAMNVPAGAHEVEFRVESTPYEVGSKVMLGSSALLILLVLGVLFFELRRREEPA